MQGIPHNLFGNYKGKKMRFEEIVSKIESYRESLKQKKTLIEVVDFGAGKPEEKRTKEQMEAGVTLEIPLCELAKIGVKREKAEVIFKIFNDLSPQKILELGTCLGFSSSYMAYFAPNAQIWSIEGSPNVAQIAKENHQHFNLKNIEVFIGRFDKVLPNLLEKIKLLDFAFIDGHHNKEATIAYFKQILPFMKRGGVMLFDDIAWSSGMQEAWSEILESHCYTKAQEFGEVWKMGALWL